MTFGGRLSVWGLLILIVAVSDANTTAREYIFELKDPHGDDHGDGTLRYPFRPDLRPGDLDLIRFAARPGEGGTWFEATFAKAIRPPGRETIDGVGTTRDRIARLGFYTLNVDVYIDTDRESGSGRTELMPGRLAETRLDDAWEKAIVLTPRPNVAEAELEREWLRQAKERTKRGKGLSREELRREKERIDAEVARLFFFPRQVRVRGHEIEFFVPDAFLGGKARSDWSYVVAVSGAELERRVHIPFLRSVTLDPNTGMILPVHSVPTERAFGGRDDDGLQPPLVDILTPSGVSQRTVLSDYDAVEGRPARLPGVMPATELIR